VMAKAKRRCLIVERHKWETGAYRHQLQFPLKIADQFFGPGRTDLQIQVRVFPPSAPGKSPAFVRNMAISRRYRQSATRRTNRVAAMGKIPSAFVFFQETGRPGVYDLWWLTDKAVVVARFRQCEWVQARNNQHGRGRLAVIVPAPVPRRIDRMD